MRRLLPSFIALATAVVCGRHVSARPLELAEGLEYNIKAAYIFNLANFTAWPPATFRTPSDPLRVCVARPNPFESALTQVFRNEQVAGHPVVVAELERPDDVRTCHVLFIGRAADGDGALEHAVAGAPVLTVGETDAFERRGGIIRFVLDSGRVRFDVNQAAAAKAGIQLSSKVLQVARKVS